MKANTEGWWMSSVDARVFLCNSVVKHRQMTTMMEGQWM